ncbi:WD40 repeat-like protein [Paxillus ammoniavirescens]|nr:WD40 repeat-like protein [Paxillus ammoniavirescens]
MHNSSHSVSPDIASVPPVISNTGYPVPIEVLKGHENGVRCACFYPDENKIVSGSQDETLRIWNRKTGATQVMRGHTRWVWDVDVSLDGKMVVSGSADKTVRIWDGESGEVMHVFEGHEDEVNSVEFSRDSSRVVSGSDDHTVRVWSIETGELAFEPIECHGMVFCVRYSPSGDRIVSGGLTVQIWNGETGVGILSIRNSEVWSLAWTVDGTHLIGGGEDEVGEVTIWNSVDGGRLRKWKAHDEWIRGLSLSPTASHLATSSWREKTAFVFDTSTGKQVAALKHDNDVKAIAFSCSGRLIATGCGDSKIYLWEAPASEDPKTTSPARPFSSLLDRPAVPLAGPSRNDGRELDPFWDSLPNRAQLPQRASPQPQWVFSRIRNTFANVFTRTPAGTAQTNLVRETVEPVEVAAGRDNTSLQSPRITPWRGSYTRSSTAESLRIRMTTSPLLQEQIHRKPQLIMLPQETNQNQLATR